jgi:hypothetical protein
MAIAFGLSMVQKARTGELQAEQSARPPMSPEASAAFLAARQDLTQHRVEPGVAKLSAAIAGGKLTPLELASFLVTRGGAYHGIGRETDAVADLTRAVAQPGIPETQKQLVQLLISQIQDSQAGLSKTEPAALLQGAQQDLAQNHPAAAVAKLSVAIGGGKLKSADQGLYFLTRGHAFSQQSLDDEALADWNRILALPDAPANVKLAAELSITQAKSKSATAR